MLTLPTNQHGQGQNFTGLEATVERFKQSDKFNPEVLTQAPYEVKGIRAKQRPSKFAEHVKQAQMFYNSLSEVEQQHMVEAATFELGHCDVREVQQRMINQWNEMDHEFALKVAEGFDFEVPEPKIPNTDKKNRTTGQQPISMLDSNNVFTAAGRKIAIMVPDGFDGTQVSALSAGLSALGCVVMYIGARKGPA